MPIIYDDDPDTLIPLDLTTMSLEELHESRDELLANIQSINDQIVMFNRGDNPEHMQTLEWRRRAAGARKWHKEELARLRLELTRRHEAYRQAKAERAPTYTQLQAYKEKNIALSTQQMRIDTKAFVEASKKVLSREVYLEIWRLARELYPDAFASQTTA